MKKSFFPHSFTWILYLLLITSFIALAIFGIISSLTSNAINYIILIVSILVFVFLTYQLYAMIISYKININDKAIYTNGDKFQRIEKVQYACSVNFSEILCIKIIASSKNSLNRQIQLKWISSSLPKKYLEFTLLNGNKERIWINQYSKKQILNLLNIIILHIKKTGNTNNFNTEEIMRDWYSYDIKKNKK